MEKRISNNEGESDTEDSSDVIDTGRQHLDIQKRRRDQTRKCRVICLQLLGSLDMIYGELLVAALDRGVSLPDPRLYLESLSGQVSNCERSVKKCPGTASSIDRESSDYNPLLRYLELRALEAVALNIPALMKAAVDQVDKFETLKTLFNDMAQLALSNMLITLDSVLNVYHKFFNL